MCFFFFSVFFLCFLSSNDLYFGLLLSMYWYYEICIWLLLANSCVKANVLLCLARLWTCIVGFSYSLSGPNIQPQSGVITPCEQKSVTRVPAHCLRLRVFLNVLQECRDYRALDVTNCQSFQMGKSIYILDNFCVFPIFLSALNKDVTLSWFPLSDLSGIYSG